MQIIQPTKKPIEPILKKLGAYHLMFKVNIMYRLTILLAEKPFVPSNLHLRDNRCQEIVAMQVAGLVKRLVHTNAPTVVIGISGGLDSTLALLVCVQAFDELKKTEKVYLL